MIRSVAAIFAALIFFNFLGKLGADLATPLARTAAGTVSLTPAYLGINVVVVAVAAVLGGMIAAHIAAAHKLMHSILLALVMVVLSIVALLSPPAVAREYPRWFTPMLAIVGPAFAVLGGWLRARREPRVEATSLSPSNG